MKTQCARSTFTVPLPPSSTSLPLGEVGEILVITSPNRRSGLRFRVSNYTGPPPRTRDIRFSEHNVDNPRIMRGTAGGEVRIIPALASLQRWITKEGKVGWGVWRGNLFLSLKYLFIWSDYYDYILWRISLQFSPVATPFPRHVIDNLQNSVVPCHSVSFISDVGFTSVQPSRSSFPRAHRRRSS